MYGKANKNGGERLFSPAPCECRFLQGCKNGVVLIRETSPDCKGGGIKEM